MKLLHVNNLLVETFSDPPTYALLSLSHTCGEEEVTFQDLSGAGRPWKTKKGYRKLRDVARKAHEMGYTHIWIDTCCIDKTSSAELQEAINSMYQYYERANKCIVYLVHVPTIGAESSGRQMQQEEQIAQKEERKRLFRCSRCFTRGWTLQEGNERAVRQEDRMPMLVTSNATLSKVEA